MHLSRRNLVLAGASALAAPAILSRPGHAVEQRQVKIGSILAGTTMAAELMPKYSKEVGVEAEVLQFPNITQRMQALAADSIQIGYGGINAAISIAGRGVPLTVLCNACDGGWLMVGKPEIKSLADLKGKKVGVQPGNICHIALGWKLKALNLAKDVELVFLNNNDMPIPLQQGQIDAMFAIEPYPSLAKVNKWGADIWDGYDTPLGRTNLVFVASTKFVEKNPVLTRELVKAHIKATKELQASPAIAAEVTARVLNLPRDVIDLSLKNTFFSYDSGETFTKTIMALGDMMVESKTAAQLPDWKSFINTSFVSNA
jgi:NitT/TauT family transport system substrate-binding protein